jgi:hypothetical protein
MPRTLLAAALVLVVAGAAAAASSTPAAGRADATVFAGLATWVDVYDAYYATPEATATRIAARGVRTVFAETANDRSAADVVKPAPLGRFVDALHERGLTVVAWYLPGFDKPARDLRRTRAMLRFRTPGGGSFDGVALDIESLRLKSVAMRTKRVLALARTLRKEAGATPVAAITYPPRALERHAGWWPRFPWSQLAPLVDAFVPMAYSGGGFPGYDATYGYVARSLRQVRSLVGPGMPIHAAGGVANRMNADELRAFADAVADTGAAGWSLYDYETTLPRGWAALRALGGRR